MTNFLNRREAIAAGVGLAVPPLPPATATPLTGNILSASAARTGGGASKRQTATR